MFSDAELDAFCLDYFPEIYNQFGRGMGKNEKITLLIDYCRRKDKLEELSNLLDQLS